MTKFEHFEARCLIQNILPGRVQYFLSFECVPFFQDLTAAKEKFTVSLERWLRSPVVVLLNLFCIV